MRTRRQIAEEAVEQLYPNVNLPPRSHAVAIIEAAIEEATAAEREKYIELCDRANGYMIEANKHIAALQAGGVQKMDAAHASEKPTGEWTVESVRNIGRHYSITQQRDRAIADAHNAALAIGKYPLPDGRTQ